MQRYDGREHRASSGEAEGALGSWELDWKERQVQQGQEAQAGGGRGGWAAGAKVRWLAKEQELAQNPAVSYLYKV